MRWWTRLAVFGDALTPLTTSPEGVAALLERGGAEVPQTGAEWITRNTPPSGQDIEDIAAWRRENIAAVAKCAASGEITFWCCFKRLEFNP